MAVIMTEQQDRGRPRHGLLRLVPVIGVGGFVWGLTFAVAAQFFYFHDDLIWQSAVRQRPSLAGYMHQPVNDHFAPLFLLVQKVVAGASDGRYWVVACWLATLAAVLFGECVAICRFFGLSYPVATALGAVFGAGSVTLNTVTWWSGAVHALSSAVLIVFVVLCALGLRDRSNGAALLLLGGILVGQFAAMGFSQKSVIWVGLAPALVVLHQTVLGASESDGRRARRDGLLIAAAQVAGAGLHFVWALAADWRPAPRQPLQRAWVSTGLRTWTDGYLPSLMGSDSGSAVTAQIRPWPWGLGPLVTVGVAIAAVLWARRNRVPRWSVLVFLVVGIAADRLALLLSRPSDVLIATSRYFVDLNLVVLFAVVAAVACRHCVGFRSFDRSPGAALPDRPPRARLMLLPLAACLYLAVIALLQPLSAWGMRSDATAWRRAFGSIRERRLDSMGPVLDVAVPWDADSYPFSRPSSWAAFAGDPAIRTTMSGLGPFVGFDLTGRVRRYRAPAAQAIPRTCATAGSQSIAVPLQLSIPKGDGERDGFDVWIEVESPTDSAAIAQLRGEVDDASGKVSGWFNPTFEVEPPQLSFPTGRSIMHVPLNPRWSGSVTELRLLIDQPVCIDAVGAGRLVADEGGGS